jgi:hypothetical protein
VSLLVHAQLPFTFAHPHTDLNQLSLIGLPLTIDIGPVLSAVRVLLPRFVN